MNLSKSVQVSIPRARQTFKKIQRNKNQVHLVAVDQRGMVLGLTTLILEQKFVHNFRMMGHIEDVVVRPAYERRGIGRALIRQAIAEAKKAGCYRLRLFCADHNLPFYRKAGFRPHENAMQLDLIKK